MANDQLVYKRKNGVYYTPDALARYLAEPLINGENVSVFDPAYGEGSLLLAAESIFSQKSKSICKIELFGCDNHPVNGLLGHLPIAHLRAEDFFNFSKEEKYDIILTNPPYVRHQNQEKKKIKSYRINHYELNFLNNNSDLWAYFLVKSITHLKKHGSLGAILPWAFIQADYAQQVRGWLKDRFGEIKVLALNNPYFDSAQERVVLLWMKNYGEVTKSIEFAFAKNIESNIKYKNLEENDWLSSKIVSMGESDLSLIFSRLQKELGFSKFNLHANSRIGVVTGADNFFIVEINNAKVIGFREDHLIPIITKAKDLPELLNNGIENLKRLICINKDISKNFKNFIQSGIKSEFHLRSHSKMRKPWYAINPGKFPDAFFPYRVGKIPYLVINEYEVQSTNSIHRIYFKELSQLEIKWIHVSMLSIYGQISLEANAKTYGRGMLKIEPGSLGKVLVLKRQDSSIIHPYNEILKRLKKERKIEAVEIATAFLNEKLNISDDLKTLTKIAWNEMKEVRMR